MGRYLLSLCRCVGQRNELLEPGVDKQRAIFSSDLFFGKDEVKEEDSERNYCTFTSLTSSVGRHSSVCPDI